MIDIKEHEPLPYRSKVHYCGDCGTRLCYDLDDGRERLCAECRNQGKEYLANLFGVEL